MVKLPDITSFENRILRLMNEPKKVTYRYTNTETENPNLIMFQNFQKLFLKNDMTLKDKNYKLIYTIRTPAGRVEQVTRKKFNYKSIYTIRTPTGKTEQVTTK